MPLQPCSPTQESSPRARAHPFVSNCIVLHWTGRCTKQKLLILSTSPRTRVDTHVGVPQKSLSKKKNLHHSLKPSATSRSCKSKTLQVRRHLLQSQAVSQRVSGIDGSRNLFNTDPITLYHALCPKLLGRQMLDFATFLSQQHTFACAGTCEQIANKIPPKDLVVTNGRSPSSQKVLSQKNLPLLRHCSSNFGVQFTPESYNRATGHYRHCHCSSFLTIRLLPSRYPPSR